MTSRWRVGKYRRRITIAAVAVMAVVVVLAMCSAAQAATFKAGLTEQQIQQHIQQARAQALQSPLLKGSVVTPGLIFSDSFESGLTAWDVYTDTGSASAMWGATTYRATDGSYSAYCLGSSAPGTYPANMGAYMDSPLFSLYGKGAATLDFDLWLNTEAGWAGTMLFIADLNSNEFAFVPYEGSTGGWQHQAINLSHVYDAATGTYVNFLGDSQMFVSFYFGSDRAASLEGAYIDNVVVKVPAPTITSLSPVTGYTNGGNSVVINGTNFTGVTGVTFGGTPATSYVVNSLTKITAVAPAHAAGSVQVQVTAGGGSTSDVSADDYNYVVPPPAVTSLSPAAGPLAGGTSVTINGTNLTGATAVSFGGVAATSFTVDSATKITATAPAHAAGAVDVAVTTAGGTSAVTGTANDFTYVDVPTISSISPVSGTTVGGTQVIITGTNFVGLSGASAVTFGGVNAKSYVVNSPTKITAVAPAHAFGPVDIVVTAAGGTSDSSGTTDDYSYTFPRYEQDNAAMGFSPGWLSYGYSQYSGGSYKYTKVAGSSATIAFVGTQLDWITTIGPSFGKAKVVVDDGVPSEVDLYNATNSFKQKVFSTGTLSSGLHTVTITCLGTKNDSATDTYIGIDAVESDGTLSAVSFADQYDSRILYKAPWSGFAATVLSGGNYYYTKSAGAMIVVPFSGQKLEWIATTGPAYGKANVSIDGGAPTLVDLYASSNQFRQVVYSTGILTAGAHTVAISYTGQKNPDATDTYINADAFQVVGTLKGADRFDQTNAKFVWTKTWTLGSSSYYYNSSFRYVNTSGASVRINFTGSSLSYIAKKAPNMGKAYVSIDGGAPVLVDLYNATTVYQQKVWSSGALTPGDHYVTITWSGQKRTGATGTYINIDAVDVVGTLR